MRTLLAVVSAASFFVIAPAALAFEIEPSDPDRCDTIVIVETLTFGEDCGWSVSGEVSDLGGVIAVALTLHQRTTECAIPLLPIEETFRVPIGSFPPGRYVVAVNWTNLRRPEERRDLAVREAVCGERSFRRGDSNADGDLNIADPVFTLNGLFLGGPIPCRDAADSDGTGRLELTDAVHALNHLFLGGPEPPAPFPDCGTVPEGAPSAGCEEANCPPPVDDEPQWMARPDGCKQCEPCAAPGLERTVAALEEMGITVLASALDAVPVCLACSVCSSGIFYAVLVPRVDVPTLLGMGWVPWNEPGGGVR
jgi:hypothetical protein